MAIQMAVGREDFEEIIKSGRYYVDKTELLYDLVEKAGDKVTLITRPRRFGKTLNMSMMESFFDVNRDSRTLFEGLHITQHEEFCQEWMNQYPVLSVSFKGIEDLNYEDAYNTLKVKLSEICKKHEYLAESPVVNEADRQVFQRLMFEQASLAEVKNSLKTLMRMMAAVYEKPVILLIDEYDVPLAKASENNTAENGYYVKMLNVVRGIFEAALKTNEYLNFAVVTGCLRITKESIFTGTNNFSSYSVMHKRFSCYFGFTQEEVNQLLSATGLLKKKETVKNWYDGYVFGNTPVYCPWDVINYVADILEDPEAEPENYWLHTSGNNIIREFVGHFKVKGKFETLMNGGTITETISDQLTYEQLYQSEQNLWSVLVMTGYLTKARPQETGTTVALKIPNAEIAGIFQEAVVSLFKDTLDISRQETLMDALWAGDEETASNIMSDLLWKTISYMDYHENYYHAFMAGIFVGTGYETHSNQESGLGRPDLELLDEENRRAMVIEVKRSGSKEDMERDCKRALEQIQDREYVKGIDPGYETVLCYGISFFRKTALVKRAVFVD